MDTNGKKCGFQGLTYIYQSAASSFDNSWNKSLFSYGVQMNPGYANMYFQEGKAHHFYPKLMRYSREIKRLLHIRYSLTIQKKREQVTKSDYDETWLKILKLRPSKDCNMIPCAFTDWDNTPRHGTRGSVYQDANPDKFKKYFKQLVENTKHYYHTDMVFIFAWNEWAEGGYLEPDERFEFGYLNAIKEVIKK